MQLRGKTLRFNHRQGSKGFTLVELLVTVAILGVLAAIAIPNYLSMVPGMRIKGAAMQLVGDLMWARMKAVAENNEFKVFFVNNHQYMLVDDQDGNGALDVGEWSQTKDIQVDYPGVTFSATADPVFLPRGTATISTITITNSAGTKLVRVHLTGRVKVE